MGDKTIAFWLMDAEMYVHMGSIHYYTILKLLPILMGKKDPKMDENCQ